ncbi:unnamed protein product [Amoebophrya sp. A25]|nr:unnamed protein product [Amoebophrya sp. A25]|eukprot:GSA25T00026330001.1
MYVLVFFYGPRTAESHTRSQGESVSCHVVSTQKVVSCPNPTRQIEFRFEKG